MNFDNSALDISIEYIYNFLPSNSIMNVAIMKNNSVIYSNCKRPNDTVNVENQIQLNLDTRFNIGSISKIFLVVGSPSVLVVAFLIIGLQHIALLVF